MKSAGLILAFAGVVVAMVSRGGATGQGALLGDLSALGAAMGWAGIALIVRTTALKTVRPEVQLLWQLVVSAPILLFAAPFFGPVLREPSLIHWAGLGFQIVAVVSAGFLFWFWLLTIYPRVLGRGLRVPRTGLRRGARLVDAGRAGGAGHPDRAGAGLGRADPDQTGPRRNRPEPQVPQKVRVTCSPGAPGVRRGPDRVRSGRRGAKTRSSAARTVRSHPRVLPRIASSTR